MDCPFCTINPERNVQVHDGKHVSVVFSNPRLMPGHLLVIPKRHVEKISELNHEERSELFDTTIAFQEKVLSRIAKGCDIRQHYRPFQKQEDIKVNHLHVHLLPRELFDELYEKSQKFETEIFKRPDEKEMTEITKILSE